MSKRRGQWLVTLVLLASAKLWAQPQAPIIIPSNSQVTAAEIRNTFRPLRDQDFKQAANGSQAVVVEPDQGWVKSLPNAPQAGWIARLTGEENTGLGENVLYAVSFFNACATTARASLELSFAAADRLGDPIASDVNSEALYLNGQPVPGSVDPNPPFGVSFLGRAHIRVGGLKPLFIPGNNTLFLYQRHFGNRRSGGVIFQARIDLTCGTPKPDLRLDKSALRGFADSGPGLFELEVSNVGIAATAQGIRVFDNIPCGMAPFPDEFLPLAWDCRVERLDLNDPLLVDDDPDDFAPPPVTVCPGGERPWVVDCDYTGSPLAPGQSAPSIPIHVDLESSVSQSAPIFNCAQVIAALDSQRDNDFQCIQVDVQEIDRMPDLTLEKSCLGDRCTLRVRNEGTEATQAPIWVDDLLPEGLSLQSPLGAVGNGWDCDSFPMAEGERVVCRFFPTVLPANHAPTLVLKFSGATMGPQENCASVRTAGDANRANDSACAPIQAGDFATFFAQAIAGGGVQSSFQVANSSGQVNNVTLEFIDSLGTARFSDSVALIPSGTHNFLLPSAAGLVVGWARLDSDGPILATEEITVGGETISVLPCDLLTGGSFIVNEAGGQATALAIANPSDQAVEVSLVLVPNDGSGRIPRPRFKIAPRSQDSRFLFQHFPRLGNFEGTARVAASKPACMLVLVQKASGDLLSIPVTPNP